MILYPPSVAFAQLLPCGGVEIFRDSSTRILPVVRAIVKLEEPDFQEREF
jgi:hypothetical protein